MGNTSKRYPAEVRERAVRLFQEHVHEYPTRWEAMQSIAQKIGCTTETLRSWGATGALLAVVSSYSSAVERMPTVMNFNFLPDMGRMNA